MNQIDEQIARCERGIEVLQANLAELMSGKNSTNIQSGDVVTNLNNEIRLVIKDRDEHLFSVNTDGRFCSYQNNFADFEYRKIGRISDFIKETN